MSIVNGKEIEFFEYISILGIRCKMFQKAFYPTTY